MYKDLNEIINKNGLTDENKFRILTSLKESMEKKDKKIIEEVVKSIFNLENSEEISNTLFENASKIFEGTTEDDPNDNNKKKEDNSMYLDQKCPNCEAKKLVNTDGNVVCEECGSKFKMENEKLIPEKKKKRGVKEQTEMFDNGYNDFFNGEVDAEMLAGDEEYRTGFNQAKSEQEARDNSPVTAKMYNDMMVKINDLYTMIIDIKTGTESVKNTLDTLEFEATIEDDEDESSYDNGENEFEYEDEFNALDFGTDELSYDDDFETEDEVMESLKQGYAFGRKGLKLSDMEFEKGITEGIKKAFEKGFDKAVAKLNELKQQSGDKGQKKQNLDESKKTIINEMVKDLSDIQKAFISDVMEKVIFENEDEFRSQVKELVEMNKYNSDQNDNNKKIKIFG